MPQAVAAETFKDALTAFQQGRLDDADDLCGIFLRTAPDHAACMHLRGAVQQAKGNLESAEAWMRRALSLNSSFAETHYSFATLLAARGKYAEAADAFRQALALKPQHARAYVGLGSALKALGHVSEAGKAYAEAIIIKPDDLEALNCLGVLFCEQKMFQEAQDCFESALQCKADLPETLNNLGVVYFERGKFAEAQSCARRALEVKPDYGAALTNLGNALKAEGKWTEAIQSYGRALKLDPLNSDARNNIGLAALHGLGDIDLAAAHFKHVLAHQPAHVPALTHLGITHCYRGDFEQGRDLYAQALMIDPLYHEAQNNLGNVLRALGRLDEAIASYEQVVAAQPANADAHHNLALAYLQTGRLAEGWKEFEWRWQTPQLALARRDFGKPQWKGEEGAGEVLLVHSEQGFGDTLQFCRYVPLAVAKGFRVVVEVQPELVRLMESLQGSAQIVGRGQALPEFDVHCPMMSLPFVFETQLESIPAKESYLAPFESDVNFWRARLSHGKEDLKVGLVWAGNPRRFSVDLSAADQRRSVAPEKFANLTKMPGVRFFNLQKDARLPEYLDLEKGIEECRDFADTAALISCLDLVISVDTASAHLAAALGKPVWLLNRFDSCWRWLMEREDSPWYPTLRLFRQPRPGDWESVISQIEQNLAQTKNKSRPSGQN